MLEVIFRRKKDQHVFHRSRRKMILTCRVSGRADAIVAGDWTTSFIILRHLTDAMGRQ